jgi:hypothetical protein
MMGITMTYHGNRRSRKIILEAPPQAFVSATKPRLAGLFSGIRYFSSKHELC